MSAVATIDTTRSPLQPSKSSSAWSKCKAALVRLADHRILSCFCVAGFVLFARLALLGVMPIPFPHIQDEFSYLLGGDTLSHGRIATPPHPMRAFFETMHVNMEPTYASKYPPGQAAFLALGMRLFGHPWYGVWLSMGLLCGLLCWMLQGWVPPKYALAGAFLASLELGITGYWMNSYWGGAVAACGGALIIGAIPRLAQRPKMSAAIAAAMGIFVLANSRPFEGSVLVALSAITLIWWSYRLNATRLLLTARVLVPLVVGCGITLAATAYYNWRVTGDPAKFPYTLNSQQYGWQPPLWFMPAAKAPPRFRDAAMKELWDWDHEIYVRSHRLPIRVVRSFVDAVFSTFVDGSGLVLPFVFAAGLVLIRLRKAKAAVVLLIGFLAITLQEKYILAHYLAPAVGLFLIVAMIGLRYLNVLIKASRRTALSLLSLMVVSSMVLCFGYTVQLIAAARETSMTPEAYRDRVIRELTSRPGQHLVMVRYGPQHNFHDEMVYNGADIDAQKVIWALDRGQDLDQRLFDYYRGRTVWLIQPDEPAPSLAPYPTSEAARTGVHRQK